MLRAFSANSPSVAHGHNGLNGHNVPSLADTAVARERATKLVSLYKRCFQCTFFTTAEGTGDGGGNYRRQVDGNYGQSSPGSNYGGPIQPQPGPGSYGSTDGGGGACTGTETDTTSCDAGSCV